MGVVVALVLASPLAVAGQAKHKLTTEQVKRAVIQQSIAHYPGSCPCPYNVTRGGSRCGRRSAYSKPGGYAPKCYARDVTSKDVRRWRERHD